MGIRLFYGPKNNVKKTYKMNNTTKQRTNGRRRIAEGRTIVMTDGLHLHSEMLSAEILGQRVTGWDYDQQNGVGYVYLVREAAERPAQIHLVNTDTWDGSWQRRLAALEAMPSRVMKRPTPVEKIVAWFQGRRNLRAGMVQKGGAR